MQSNSYSSLDPDKIGEAIRAFMAESCPACGSRKARLIDPLCADCFARLPAELQAKISDRKKFIETYHPAIEHLKVSA